MGCDNLEFHNKFWFFSQHMKDLLLLPTLRPLLEAESNTWSWIVQRKILSQDNIYLKNWLIITFLSNTLPLDIYPTTVTLHCNFCVQWPREWHMGFSNSAQLKCSVDESKHINIEIHTQRCKYGSELQSV